MSHAKNPDTIPPGMPKAGPVGLNLCRLRQARGWSQQTLADRAKCGRITIATLENGDNQSPSIRTLRKLADALGVEISALTAEPPAEGSSIEREIEEFLRSPWAQTLTPPVSKDELAALRATSQATWVVWRPTPKTLHFMVLGLRASREPAGRQR